MKALRIPIISLLISLFLTGTQSHTALKMPVKHFQNNFPSALTQLKTTLAQEMAEINEIKNSVGKSSSKAENLLNKCIKVISYLDDLLEASPDDTLKCLVPGAKPDPVRGVCYLLVTNPLLIWREAKRYCHDLGGHLLAPLPLDTTLGDTLSSLFPELITSTGDLWVDGEDESGFFVYENDYITPYAATVGHLTMELPLSQTPDTPPTIVEDTTDEDDTVHPFICQLYAVPNLPPFKMSHGKDEDDTHIPDKKYLVDVESGHEVHYHSGENSDGYGHPNGDYYGNGHNGDGHHGDGHPGEGDPHPGYPRKEKLAEQLKTKIAL